MKKICIVLCCIVMAVMLVGCVNYEYKEGDFSLEITVDKTTATVGDTVEITATFKNLSGRSIPILFYDYVTYKKTNKVSNLIQANSFPESTGIVLGRKLCKIPNIKRYT